MKQVTIYTDGACSGNPGPGGWAAYLRYGSHEKEISGASSQTTNNRMEMQAAIEALSLLKEPCNVLLHTDSAYLARAFNDGWIERWIVNGWKTASKAPVENRDLWEELIKLTKKHNVKWVKVRGHATDNLNNRVDKLAVLAMKNAG